MRTGSPVADLAALSPAQLRAVLGYPRNFARLTDFAEGEAAFAYDLDRTCWPWLSLPAGHPVVLEKYQYFTTVTAALAFGDMKPGVRSALTGMSWSLGPAGHDAGYADRSRCQRHADEQGNLNLSVQLGNAQGEDLGRILCQGRSFPDRDFASWRSGSRDAVLSRDDSPAFIPASLADGRPGFVSGAQRQDGLDCVLARVSAAEGFHPRHPFHTGSGDHVNAAQLFDCALQAAEQWPGAGPRLCLGGEARFLRFVELDAGFEILCTQRDEEADGGLRLDLLFRQGGRDNTKIRLALGPAVA